MRQRDDGGLPGLRQKTPDANGETLSEMNIAPVAFSLNQSSVLCLPVVSDSHKLIWVHSKQITLQLDGAAELDKAFDRFPYLTQKQTAALAQRCSLHPDQVRVWFMVQRLRYGISWDYEDISKVRRKFNWRKEELRNKTGEEVKSERGENKQRKREVEVSGGAEAGEVMDEHGTNERRVMGESVSANEQLERKINQEQLTKTKKNRKVEENKSRKRKWVTQTDEMRRTRMKQADEDVLEGAEEAEIKSDEDEREWQESTLSETTLCTRKKKKTDKISLSAQESPARKSFDEPPLTNNQKEPLTGVDIAPLSIPNVCMTPVKSGFERKTETKVRLEGLQSATSGAAVTYVIKVMEVNGDPVVEEGPPIFTQQQDSHTVDICPLPTQTRYRRTTAAQMAMMKVAFLQCQYPDREDYNQLVKETGVPRCMLVQWFSDMRYYVKKGNPRWLNLEQRRQILANIMYQQCLNEMAKLKPMSKAD